MNQIGTKVLETQRLILRPIEEGDVPAIYEIMRDEQVVKYLRVTQYISSSQAEAFVRSVQERYLSRENGYFWAIAQREDNRLAGTIVLNTVHQEDEVAQVGFSLARAHWRKGYMTEALKAVLSFGLKEVCYNRIEAVHAVGNPASGAAMRNAGMLFEGTCREKYKNDLGYHNAHMYAILKKDLA